MVNVCSLLKKKKKEAHNEADVPQQQQQQQYGKIVVCLPLDILLKQKLEQEKELVIR